MTAFELQQPEGVFFHAGRIACQMDVPFLNNPYPKETPYYELWHKGYMREAKRYKPKVTRRKW